MREALDQPSKEDLYTFGQMVPLSVFCVEEPRAENGLSECEEQECALGLLYCEGIRLIVLKIGATMVAVVCPGQSSPSRFAST